MSSATTKYGRDDDDWDQLADAGHAFLIERARLRKTTSYTELNTVIANRTGLPGFDFGQDSERAAMGHLLWLIVERDVHKTNLMLSALVQYLDANDAGTGFYKYAMELGLLPRGAGSQQKEAFWIHQLSAIHDYYARI